MGERLFYSRFVFQALLLLLLSAGCLSAESTELQFGAVPPGERWTITTRWDYRVRIDGRYIGHTSRELREVYERQQEVPAGWLVDGDARILGATKKDGYPVAARLESSESISFILGINGAVMDAGDSFPRLRGFPTFPEGEIQQGDQWEAPLDVLISGPDGERAVLPQTASYRYLGRKPYMGEEAHYFEVLWAIRYKGYNPDIDMFLEQVEGSHRVSLVVDAETGVPIMARDNMKEIWSWADSRTEERDGFALIFWDGVPPLDTGGIRREFENRFPGEVTGAIVVGETTAGGEEESGVSGEGERAGSEDIIFDNLESELDDSYQSGNIMITETTRGLSVTLSNLHFQPDLAVLLSEDRPLLDELANILSGIPGRTVLVRGHTADVGRPEDQYNLSEERAKAVADELSLRGIDPRRLIYEGIGADEPLASNDSEAGRRRNRRVELVILED